MKNNRGFAPILILLIVVVLGGITYAVVPKSVLKSFFEKGDTPTEAQRTELKDKFQDGDIPNGSDFQDTIDSSLNIQEDSKLLGLKQYDATKAYVAGDTAVHSQSIYEAKVLTQKQAEFKLDANQPVTFRWTPVPAVKPEYTLVYRLKVWQLMEGQNGAAAMKSNQPIITKDVMNANEVTVSGIYTGPCKPPYLCDFVWDVEVMTVQDGKAGTSEPMTTSATETTTAGASGGSTGDSAH